MATDMEKRLAKAKKTKAFNKAEKVRLETQLRKAQATARNATQKLNEYKKGLKDGIEMSRELMRSA